MLLLLIIGLIFAYWWFYHRDTTRTANVNLRKGLFRLWLIATVIFVAFMFMVSYSAFQIAFGLVPQDGYYWTTPAYGWRELKTYTGIAIGLPLAVLVLGRALLWAFAGFKKLGASQ